jgi:cytoskeletal protein RodZ
MAITRSRPFPRRERRNLWSPGIRLVAFSIAALLMLETSIAAGAQQSAPPQAPQLQNARPATTPEPTVQDARNEALDSLPSAPTPQPAQQAPAQQQAPPQQPVGTAAAPYEKPTGVPGSRPAGAAIAPAKQRRVRAIAIRVGIVLAAGAAVGAVVGLSKATHSTPQ